MEVAPIRNRYIPLLLCLLCLVLFSACASAGPPVAITQQPNDCYVQPGSAATVSLTAQGDDLQYQWFFKNADREEFYKTSCTEPVYTVVMGSEQDLRQLYCVVTDRYGNSLTSDTVTLKIPRTLQIVTQPENRSVLMGMDATVSVTAQGEALQYQWYVKTNGQDQFCKTDCTDSVCAVTMDELRNGQQFFCAVTDGFGNYLQSQTVTLSGNSGFQKQLYKLRPDESLSLQSQLTFEAAESIAWYSSDTAIATVDDTGTVTGIEYGTVTITGVGETSGFRICCNIKVCDLKRVALTFDDGPSSHTARLLDFLEEHEDVKVTFFVVGSRLNNYAETVRRIVQQGHELGYHSYGHKTQTRLSNANIISRYEQSSELLTQIAEQSFTLWRTPGGAYNDRVLDCIALPHIMWSVDTRDWATRNSVSVYYSIINNSKDGSIVLLHDLHGTTVDGAIRAIEDMLEGDYEFLTVTELLCLDGTAPEPHTTYFRG